MNSTTLMRRALRLALKASRHPSPNPPVGAIVLSASGDIVGQGWHEGPGTRHAEVVALEEAGIGALGGTLIVTLAPCTRHGKTPPCHEAVIASGIAKVIVGVRDPNPSETQSSIELLAAAGIQVDEGIESSKCAELIGGFEVWARTGRPRVTLKIAQTLDGRTAAADGSSRWITGPGARREVHRMRASSDAVLVGVGTVLADDPALTVRLRSYSGPQPTRVIVDSVGRTPYTAKLFDGVSPVILATTKKAPEVARASCKEAGAEILLLPELDGRVDLGVLLDELGRRGMVEVLAEPGPTLSGSLVESGLVDRLVAFVAPKILGPHGSPSLGNLLIPSIDDAIDLNLTSVRRVGPDLRLEGRMRS